MLLTLIAAVLQAAAPPSSSSSIDCSGADPRACATSIYFDSGEGTAIRPEWTAQLDAAAARVGNGGRVRLDAFTDRSGPSAANRRIAALRGASVAAALSARGVEPSLVTIVAHGEADPLVATPDGVREPQNRRVDLTIVR